MASSTQNKNQEKLQIYTFFWESHDRNAQHCKWKWKFSTLLLLLLLLLLLSREMHIWDKSNNISKQAKESESMYACIYVQRGIFSPFSSMKLLVHAYNTFMYILEEFFFYFSPPGSKIIFFKCDLDCKQRTATAFIFC